MPEIEIGPRRLLIGRMSDAPAYEFHHIVAGALRPDSSVVVVDGGKQIKVFRADGSFLFTVGRPGGGPGELEWVQSLQIEPDGSIIVYDPVASRITVWGEDGRFKRTLAVPWLPTGPLHAIHLLDDGEAIGVRVDVEIVDGVPKAIGLWRSPAVAVHLDREMRFRDTLAVIPGEERYYYPMAGYERARSTRPLLAARPVFGFHDECIYGITSGDVVMAEFCRGHTGIRRRFDWFGADLNLNHVEFANHGVAMVLRRTGLSVSSTEFVRMYPFDVPERTPPAGSMVVDDVGFIWLAEYLETDMPASRWMVFDTVGVLRGQYYNPAIHRILAIEHGSLLAVERDELDVERIAIYDRPRVR